MAIDSKQKRQAALRKSLRGRGLIFPSGSLASTAARANMIGNYPPGAGAGPSTGTPLNMGKRMAAARMLPGRGAR